MLEQLKQDVYEANMELPGGGWSPIPGEMCPALTGKKVCL